MNLQITSTDWELLQFFVKWMNNASGDATSLEVKALISKNLEIKDQLLGFLTTAPELKNIDTKEVVQIVQKSILKFIKY